MEEEVKYLGVKIVSAVPMTKHAVADLKGAPCSEPDEDGYKVTYGDGYTSWSPRKAFEDAYRPVNNLTFGLAVEALKKGMKVARAGWNGKGMYLLHYSPVKEMPAAADGFAVGYDVHPLLPFILMKTADSMFVPWLASQTDILAEDWVIVE